MASRQALRRRDELLGELRSAHIQECLPSCLHCLAEAVAARARRTTLDIRAIVGRVTSVLGEEPKEKGRAGGNERRLCGHFKE